MTQSKKDKINFTFQLKKIELLEFALNQLALPISEQTTFHFDINLEQQIILEKNLVIAIPKIEVIYEDKKTKLASLKASCIFEVSNLKDFLNKEKTQVLFPDEVLLTLNSITISTVRGIMFSQFRGTYLHNAILPIIDPKSFTQKKKTG